MDLKDANRHPKQNANQQKKSKWTSIHWIKQIKSLTACWQNKDQTIDGAYSSRIVDDVEDEKEPYAK